MMDKLDFELENCYGINKLYGKFDFGKEHKIKKTRNNVFIVYAPNGTMKTSFTKTLLDLSKGNKSKDEVYNKDAIRVIKKSDGTDLLKEDVFVIESMNNDFSPRTSMLLASTDLKKRYDNIQSEVEKSKNKFMISLEKLSGIKRNGNLLEDTFISDFREKYFFDSIENIYSIMLNNKLDFIPENLVNIRYVDLFNKITEKFLNDKDNQILLNEYIDKYNEIIEKSLVYKKGMFNHNNAINISKSLSENGFFDVNYSVNIGNEEHIDKIRLESIIKEERERVLNDEELTSKFDAIDKQMEKKGLQKLREILQNNRDIISELKDIPKLKQKLWISYIIREKLLYENILELYRESIEELRVIVEQAKEKTTLWHDVVKEFNNRFNVPFKVEIENKEDVILKDITPRFKFIYNNRGEDVGLSKDELLNVLSGGEKRALYILNILFEIKTIEKENRRKLIVIDDIADSFDYKNKYAIVEYLKDMQDNKNFNIIILTHNFDFYRTIGTRLDLSRQNCIMVSKDDKEIKLMQGEYLQNVFEGWKKQIYSNDRILIASIPFVRNLSEYIEGKESDNYKVLTNLLHLKENTESITLGDLINIYKSVWRIQEKFPVERLNYKVKDIIYKIANDIYNEGNIDKVNLENKIVLSMGIRLLAEEYMKSILKENSIEYEESNSNQTVKLLDYIKNIYKENSEKKEIVKILQQVALMTPENIHINSFMYEPLLDLSDYHLKKLYGEVSNLLNLSSIDEDLIYKEVAFSAE